MQWTVMNRIGVIQPNHTVMILLVMMATMMMVTMVSLPEEGLKRIRNMTGMKVEEVTKIGLVIVGMC